MKQRDESTDPPVDGENKSRSATGPDREGQIQRRRKIQKMKGKGAGTEIPQGEHR